mmetsp:Transcript_37225/g.63935  ORF Transcript_37225/g.63935 Transcript_37225/m.63935 type:complete len:238 (+) Transcript_37225:281-994(+)
MLLVQTAPTHTAARIHAQISAMKPPSNDGGAYSARRRGELGRRSRLAGGSSRSREAPRLRGGTPPFREKKLPGGGGFMRSKSSRAPLERRRRRGRARSSLSGLASASAPSSNSSQPPSGSGMAAGSRSRSGSGDGRDGAAKLKDGLRGGDGGGGVVGGSRKVTHRGVCNSATAGSIASLAGGASAERAAVAAGTSAEICAAILSCSFTTVCRSCSESDGPKTDDAGAVAPAAPPASP